MEDRENEARELAYDVLKESSSLLLVRLRYLSRAVAQLPCAANDKMSFGTDGTALYFEPWSLLVLYQADPKSVARNYLHSILHCIFLHPFVGTNMDQDAWNLATDMAVEYLINDLNLPELQSRRAAQQAAFQKDMKENMEMVTAERLYHRIKEKHFSPKEMHELRALFVGDEHGLWYGKMDPANAKQIQTDREQVWKEVSRRVQTQAETLDRNKEGSGAMSQALAELHRTKVSYETFLRKFGTRGEALRPSAEEFDYAYYLYGMEHYGNMPLVEPLEYSEQRRIRDFVIAIDTSGSVQGDIVQSFVQKTFEILQQKGNFFSHMNLFLIQCDNKIEEAVHLQSERELEEYLKTMEIHGLGTTDFRPVFRYVEDLQRSGELRQLQGLLYFTDGRGTFPKHKPPYPTAFILHEKNLENQSVPPWAGKLIVTEEEIHNGTF